jgi:hypothetical protein
LQEEKREIQREERHVKALDIQGEVDHEITEAEIGMMHLQAKGC